jgi:epoxyqueuosine reductase QueG
MGGKAKNIMALLREMGADAAGVADMSRYDREILGFDHDVPYAYPYAISFGLLVPSGVLETLTDGPTLFYLHHYRQVNYRLDIIAYELAKAIEARGGRALPFAASQVADWQNQKGHISHKHIGVSAGVGWIGRNNLLVHPRFGARVRYNTVLTDQDLMEIGSGWGDTPPKDKRREGCPPSKLACGECRACIAVCPVNAIKKDPAGFDHKGCFAMLQHFRNKRNLGHHICGLCVKACGGKA